jgi:phosphoribosylanthranilate isomerase
MARTRIKICGIKDDDALLAAAEAGADAVGFVFVESSPRYVDPETAFALMSGLPPFMASVAVVADPDLDAFIEIEETCPTTYIQLHGNENDKVVKALGPDVFKAVRFDPQTIAAELAKWEDCEDVLAILVDGQTPGSGEPVDWQALAAHTDHLSKPVILAGGLTPANVGEAIRIIRPYGVDVSSGVERDRGLKDPALIEAFCRAVREADG